MKLGLFASLVGMFTALLSGCSSVQTAQHFGSKPIQSYKTGYVVLSEDTDEDIGAALKQALTQHGVRAGSGPLEQKPKDAQFHVNFVDHWSWDMTMYLRSLDVRFIDSASGNVIASAGYQNAHFHGFPDRKQTAIDLVDKIYGPPTPAE